MVALRTVGNANSGRNLPVPLESNPQRRRPQPVRTDTRVSSDFASQLIAARDRLPVQRQKRRASEGDALQVYDRTARLSERRMPIGYRLSVSA